MSWAAALALGRRYWWAIAIVAGAIAFATWLALHDSRVRETERTRLEKTTVKRAAKATVKADAKAETRQETINATVENIRNSSSTDDWFERMRARPHPSAPAGK